MSNDSNDWLRQNSGSSYPAVAFETVGAVIAGKIIETPRVVDSEFDGKSTQSLVVAVEATEGTTIRSGKADSRVDTAVGDKVSIWIKAGAMATAVQKALSAASATGLQEGGTLAVQYTGDGERKPGKNPPKLYAAQYKAPVASVSLAGLV